MFAYRRKKHSNIFSIPVKTHHRKIQISWRAWLWGIFSISALAGLLYFVFWSPVFKIKELVVESTNFTATAQAQELVNQLLQRKIWKVIPGDSLAVFSGNEAVHLILASFPEAQSAQIGRDILKGVKIMIKGRQSAAIWCQSAAFAPSANQATTTAGITLPQSERCFFADSNGLIFHAAPEISGTAMPTFFGPAGQSFEPGNQALASSTIRFATDLKKQLRDINVEVAGFMTGEAGSTDLVVYTGEGWQVYFNLTRSAQSQVKVLAALLAGDLKDKTASLKYVDLRVAGKVYYR